jgi:hypothetical protein
MAEGRAYSGPLHTMAQGREAVDFHQSDCAQNQEFALSTLHTKGQSPKAVALQNAYMATLFDQG